MKLFVSKKKFFLSNILGLSLLIFLTSLFGSCKDGKAVSGNEYGSLKAEKTETAVAQIVFDSLSHDFGQIREGEQVGWYFKFHNAGESDLIITNVSATCGCTVPGYDTKPVPPGAEGNIKVIFDSKGRSGKQQKTITVETNANVQMTKLRLEADIVSNN